jgi:carboxypeptidase family protein
MMRRRLIVASIAAATAAMALLPATAHAQAAVSGIAGVVKDSSGAVIPGVTVEAASPALIERVRSVVTDGQGQYKIVDLRPGVYTVTFTLGGFSTFKRDALELPPGFTATVNAEMRVGAVEESVTVSGASPVVDVQSNKDQKVLSQQTLESLPAGRNPNAYTPLIAGVVGNLGQVGVFGGTFTIHGSAISSTSLAVDGFETNSMAADGAGFIYYLNMASIQESSVSVSGEMAELQKSGVRNNVVPKTGGNKLSGFMFVGGGNHNLQANNLTDKLKNAGLTAVNSLDVLYDVNPAWGGPLVKDKLWFYNAYRMYRETDFIAGLYYNATPTAWTYTPDLSRQADNTVWDHSANLRLTWQASQNNRIGAFLDRAPHCTCNRGFSSTVSPEATQIGIFWPNYFGQLSWRYTPTSRLLLETGAGSSWGSFQYNRQPGVAADTIAISDQQAFGGISYRANSTYGQNPTNPVTIRAALTYVTGSHAAKFGFSDVFGHNIAINEAAGSRSYRFLNGVPNQVTLQATPSVVVTKMNADLGLYAQDRWTLKHLTVNYGLRFDYFHGSVPEQDEAALLRKYGLYNPIFVPVRTYPAVDNVPNWKDLNPRMGAIYDLFGDGKTAVKAFLGRYVAGQTVTIATANNPITTSITSATRTWTDGNRDYVVDCDFSNPATNAECGPLSPVLFGQANPNATKYADDVIHGYGKRGYNWEMSAGVQRELRPGMSVNATYYRRWFGNFSVTQNTATAPGDYSPYCINAPVDPRLPGGGGNQICGYYDVNPNKFGQVLSLITQSSDFGKQESVWDGIGVTTSVRLPGAGVVQGGVDAGRLRTNNCYVLNQPNLSGLANSPNTAAFCDVRPPVQPQIKFLAVYPIKWQNIQLGASYQNLPGPQILANFTATNAQIAPSLGRNLSAGANGNATLSIIPPGAVYGARAQELDISFRKPFKAQFGRLMATVDIYNVLNRSDVLTYNNTFGQAWLRPTAILTARWVKFGAQFDF